MKKFFALLIVFALFVAESKAQPGFDDDVEDAPIPGGVILVVVAMIFGMYKMYELRKQEKQLKSISA
jgi:hypothetical protein